VALLVAPNSRRLIVNLSLFWPLIAFAAPTLVIGFGLVIPRSCIAGVNELTIGFAMTMVGACLTYWLGIGAARRTGGSCRLGRL
jgi:hypothetical protein